MIAWKISNVEEGITWFTFIKESYYILFNKNLIVILRIELQNYIPSMLG